MPKLSQARANDSLAFVSSKQKRVPTSARSIHQSTFVPFAMREASPRNRSSCFPAARTIRQYSLGKIPSSNDNQNTRLIDTKMENLRRGRHRGAKELEHHEGDSRGLPRPAQSRSG